MTVFTDQIPAAMQTIVRKLSSFKTTSVKLQCENSATVASGATTSVRLPSSNILNFQSLAFHGKIAIATTASTVPPIEAFVDRVTVNMGSQQVDQCTNHGDLFMCMNNISGSTIHERNKYVYGLAPQPTYVCVAGTNLTGAQSNENGYEKAASIAPNSAAGVIVQRLLPQTIAAAGSVPFVMTDFQGILSSLNYVDMNFLPDTEIELTMNSDKILGSQTGTWSFTNCYWTVDLLTFPAYTQSMLAAVNVDAISISWTRWVNTNMACAAVTDHFLKYSLASSNLQKIFYTRKLATYSNRATAIEAGSYAPNWFKYQACDDVPGTDPQILYDQVKIDSQSYPQYRRDITNYGYFHLLNEINKAKDTQYDTLIESTNDYKVRKFLSCFNFEFKDARSGEVSGVNTLGLSSQVELDISFNTDCAAGTWLIFNKCAAILQISPGRVVSVSY